MIGLNLAFTGFVGMLSLFKAFVGAPLSFNNTIAAQDLLSNSNKNITLSVESDLRNQYVQCGYRIDNHTTQVNDLTLNYQDFTFYEMPTPLYTMGGENMGFTLYLSTGYSKPILSFDIVHIAEDMYTHLRVYGSQPINMTYRLQYQYVFQDNVYLGERNLNLLSAFDNYSAYDTLVNNGAYWIQLIDLPLTFETNDMDFGDGNFIINHRFTYLANVRNVTYENFNNGVFDNLDDYQNGYDFGYTEGYNQGNLNGQSEGYSLGYGEGLTEGYDNGYSVGYNAGLDLASQGDFYSLFGAIADTPVLIVRGLFDFEFFGVNLMHVVLSMFTALVVLFVVRKLI